MKPQPDGPDDTVARLVALIDELGPLLEAGGRAYCYLSDRAPEKRPVVRLDDYRVQALLIYLYSERYGSWPNRAGIHQATDFVQGRLLKTRRGPQSTPDDPTLVLFLAVAADHEGCACSAQEVLN